MDSIWQVGDVATNGVRPTLTLLLDMDVQAAICRIDRTPDRMEGQGLEYLKRVRQGFLDEVQRYGESIVVIDAARDIDSVQEDIRAAAQRVI